MLNSIQTTRKISKNLKAFCSVVIPTIMIRCKFAGSYENHEGTSDKITFWLFYASTLRSPHKHVLFIGQILALHGRYIDRNNEYFPAIWIFLTFSFSARIFYSLTLIALFRNSNILLDEPDQNMITVLQIFTFKKYTSTVTIPVNTLQV